VTTVADLTDRKAHGVLGGVREAVVSPEADRLRREAAAFAAVQAERLLAAAGRRLGEKTARITGGRLAEAALKSGRKLNVDGLRSAVGTGAGALTSTAKDVLRHLPRKDGGDEDEERGGAVTTIVEDVHVGVPAHEAYEQWTRCQDFSRFAKGVESVRPLDGTSSEWHMKVFGVGRSWTARITEQVPDERVAWTTEGDKGTTRGVVTFHPLGESLTEVLLVMEYHPRGVVERTANLWRAQGRRARLDLKNFRRFVTLTGSVDDEDGPADDEPDAPERGRA
jgi:uncharacterized membrane protein